MRTEAPPCRTTLRKSLAANKKFFQVSSFSWVCNKFIAIQICVYKKTCLLSTWQKPAEVALRKYKWEERYFLGEKISIQTGNKMESSWKRHLDFQCRAVFTPVKAVWGESRTKAHQQELKPRTQAKVCGETLWTSGETSRKAECTNKVMFGDAQWAWKSILLPLVPERSPKHCKKHQAQRRVAWMRSRWRRSTATSTLRTVALKKEQQTCLQVEVRNSER